MVGKSAAGLAADVLMMMPTVAPPGSRAACTSRDRASLPADANDGRLGGTMTYWYDYGYVSSHVILLR